MRVILDNLAREAVDVQETLKILAEYEKTVASRGRVVSHYLINGAEVADIVDSLKSVSEDDIQSVAVVTREPQQLVKEIVVSAVDFMPRLREGIEQLTENLVGGQQACEDIWLPILDGLEWVNDLVTNFRGLIDFRRDYLSRVAGQWREQLAQLLAAWESGDKVLLADILQYELISILEDLENYFREYMAREGKH